MQNGEGRRFITSEDLKRIPPSPLPTTPTPRSTEYRTPIPKTKSKNMTRFMRNAIPENLAPLIPGLDPHLPAAVLKRSKKEMPRAPGMEPHYDIEHFVPSEDEVKCRGIFTPPFLPAPPNPLIFQPPKPQVPTKRKTKLQKTARASDVPTLPHISSHGAPIPIVRTYGPILRHHETLPDHANKDQYLTQQLPPFPFPVHELAAPTTPHFELAAPTTPHCELEAPTTNRNRSRSKSRKPKAPKISITPSSPTSIDFKFDVSDNTLLTPPPICYKKRDRRRQSEADLERSVQLFRSRSPSLISSAENDGRRRPNVAPVRDSSGFGKMEAPSRAQDERSNRRPGSSGRAVSPDRKEERVKLGPLPFEIYACSLFG